MSSSNRVLFSCVGENNLSWFHKIENLVLSVRLFGEKGSRVPIVVNFVGGVEREFARSLASLEAEVRVVEPVDRRAPSSNKLRMLELADSDDFDVLMMVDCDIVVRGDVTSAVSTTRVRAAPAIGNPFPPAVWERIYEAFELPVPVTRTVMAVTGERTYPYYNSGVLLVPRTDCGRLLDAWNIYRDRWLALTADQPELFVSKHCGRSTIRQDQPSLSFALAATGLDVDALPVNLNLRTFGPGLARPYRHQWGPPFMFHYHGRIADDGFLLPSPNRRVAPYLDEFNRARASALNVPAPHPAERAKVGHSLRRLRRDIRKRVRTRMVLRRQQTSDAAEALRAQEGYSPPP